MQVMYTKASFFPRMMLNGRVEGKAGRSRRSSRVMGQRQQSPVPQPMAGPPPSCNTFHKSTQHPAPSPPVPVACLGGPSCVGGPGDQGGQRGFQGKAHA